MASGSIERRVSKNGAVTYAVRYRDQSKEQRYRSFKRKKDADAFLAKVISEINAGTYQPNQIKNIGFRALAEKWLELKRPQVRPKTYKSYKAHIARLMDAFGDTNARAISALDVETFAAKLATHSSTNRSREPKELSPASIGKAITILTSIFDAGVRWGYVAQNPARGVKKPRLVKAEVEYLTDSEIVTLLNAADEKHRCILMTACYTGMRQGELLALRWGDIDFSSGKIYIRRTLQSRQFCEPKTHASKRQIFVPQVLIDELRLHQVKQAVELETNPHNLVFPGHEGNPMDPRNLVRHIFEPTLKRAGLRRINFHALRHSYVSMLINQGANVKLIQKQVGHSSAQMTWDVYGHLYPEAERAAIEQLGDAIKKADHARQV